MPEITTETQRHSAGLRPQPHSLNRESFSPAFSCGGEGAEGGWGGLRRSRKKAREILNGSMVTRMLKQHRETPHPPSAPSPLCGGGEGLSMGRSAARTQRAQPTSGRNL